MPRGRIRLVIVGSDGLRRPFLTIKSTADGGAVLAPVGVPGLLREWKRPAVAEVPQVKGLHMTVHGDGVVHIRENNTNKDLDSFRVPPLRDFAAAAYWLHVFPGPLANYREDNIPQPGDLEIHIGEAEGKVHQVLVAVAVGHDPSLRTRVALPGLVPDAKERALKHFPKDDADLVVQAVLVWLPNEVGLPPERETWALVRLPDGGNYLPRPLGGTGEPTVWDPLLKELRAAGMKGP